MCGFVGEMRRRGLVDLVALGRMAVPLRRRGPDGEGVWSDGRLGLSHRRLTIIDLSERGSQPMLDPELGLAIVFNGCVYNHAELRRELEGHGYRFFSTSDTEVIVKAVHRWGPAAVERFRGMFAFALWDTDEGRLLLARDRLGIKPLYYADSPDRLRFASTLPALVAGGVETAIDPVALHHYLSWHGVVPPPHTLLRGVRKVPPATTVVVEPDGRWDERRYWEPPFARRDDAAGWTDEDWTDAVLQSLRDAVEWRMVSDVGVGVLLSGGLDSSLIVALLADLGHQDVATFSIGFASAAGREGDEFRWSDLVAERFGTDHRRLTVGDDEVAEAVRYAIAAMSEPMPSHDAVAFYLLSKEVVRERKVVQSGQGADEVFAGYSWYPPVAAVRGGDGFDVYREEFFDRSHRDVAALIEPEHRLDRDASEAIARERFARPGADEPLDRALRLDTEVMLVDDPVKRLDNMSMAWGLEVRTPFLDHELVELAAACPPSLKLADGGKGVLKAAARRLLPAEVIDRPKGYFPVPALSELSGPTLELAREALTAPAARERGLFRPDRLDDLLAEPSTHRTRLDASTLWQLAVVELWLQNLAL